MRVNQRTLILSALLFLFCILVKVEGTPAQQAGDTTFKPTIENPTFKGDSAPVVFVDEAHNNFHTVNGRYQPFARLLRQDGYTVKGLSSSITKVNLDTIDILVVSNALADSNLNDWSLPTPSAFSGKEINNIEKWVNNGGSLLLIADHMPFPGAVEKLARRFGIIMGNGFAFTADSSGLMQFTRAEGTLQNHPITHGRDSSELVQYVTSFAGQAFRIQRKTPAEPLMILDEHTVLLLPKQAWEFSDQTPRIGAGGMLQGIALEVGSGRVAVFGEAAMFTAQLAGEKQKPMGMNNPKASQNAQFLLNVVHWLSGILP